MCRTILTAIAATAACSVALAAGSASGAGVGGVMPAGWTHAEINYAVGGVPHTLILDRGRVIMVTLNPASLTLKEQDGSTVQVPLASSTQVTIGGRPSSISAIRWRSTAVTQRVDGGPATQVRVQLPARLR